MMIFLQYAIAFIVALGILITFHEFGHYWVAKRCNVKILRFSVGFGKPIWKRIVGPDKTEFVVAALPLGGYVKMLDEREGQVRQEEKVRAFNNKPVGQRIAIVLAGPAFNFIFAVFAYWLMFGIGIEDLKPVIAEVEKTSIASSSGMQAGDEIVRIEQKKTPTWEAVLDAVVVRVVKEKQTLFVLRDENAIEREILIDLSAISVDEMAEGGLLKRLGITPKRPESETVVQEVYAGKPGQVAGLQAGDKLYALDGERITRINVFLDKIKVNPENTLGLEVVRDEQVISMSLIPEKVLDENNEEIGRIGVVMQESYLNADELLARNAYPFWEGLLQACNKTLDMSVLTLRILGKMIVGEASVKNLSGPITIAKYAGISASLGIVTFLGFLAMVSVSLGVLNLLPVPLLDGGHLLYYLVEWVKGSPVSESTQIIGQQVGLALLLGLMSLAFYNDILRLVS